MSKKKFGGRKIVKSIKTKDSVFFTRNLRFIKKLTIAMEELNDYRSTPERADDQTSDDSEDEHRMDEDSTEKVNSYNSSSSEAPVSDSRTDLKKDSYQNQTSKATSTSLSPQTLLELAERCRYIPMRLTEDERRLLNVLENALEVCEYTDTVDVTYSHTGKSKQSRIISSLVDLLSIACGLLMANNLTKGESLLSGKTLTENVDLFATIFEIGRRYKIMNPGKMRNTYGKLMWILMDTESYAVKEKLQLNFVRPIVTIESFLKRKGSLSLLSDIDLLEATQPINDINGQKTQKDLVRESTHKNQICKEVIERHASAELTDLDIQRVIDSISDNEAYLAFNVGPVDRAIQILEQTFNPNKPDEHYSLELKMKLRKSFMSLGGFSSRYINTSACLSHDHATQYTFVLQSLTLWRQVMKFLPKLWLYTDTDLIGEQYRLVDTGQGYHRLQSCPHVSAEIRRILSATQKSCGAPWVGLSVIHLGDRDVPNALVFIDKYTQVPRILAPIVRCIDRLPALTLDPAFHKYVSDEWGSIFGLRMQILSDFFKHGFDGSGDDGGSCIDGRLTSAWNWCSKLHKKPYYNVFMFTGFQGFDGDWKED